MRTSATPGFSQHTLNHKAQSPFRTQKVQFSILINNYLLQGYTSSLLLARGPVEVTSFPKMEANGPPVLMCSPWFGYTVGRERSESSRRLAHWLKQSGPDGCLNPPFPELFLGSSAGPPLNPSTITHLSQELPVSVGCSWYP